MDQTINIIGKRKMVASSDAEFDVEFDLTEFVGIEGTKENKK